MSFKPEPFGKYVLLEKLAMGGMAEVYLAKTQAADNLSKFVAIKKILPQFCQNNEFIDMFKVEAKIAINLSHSNIVGMFDFDIKDDQFYLAMEYVEGRNLRQIANKIQKANLKLPIEYIVYIANEIAKGLDHAHKSVDRVTGRPLNVIHRDISPQNVMINFDGEAKICDFGIAKAESRLEATQVGTLKGKFGYMSPEQADGYEVDCRTDVFSLGILLWELLAQERLFVANNEVNTLRKIRDCNIPSLRQIDPSIPEQLENITKKALEKDRNLRYQSAAELHRDLNRFLNTQYPDFSAQDFSNFVKQVYAEEREEHRKRMIEYAKVQIDGARPRLKRINTGQPIREPSQITQTETDLGTDPEFMTREIPKTQTKKIKASKIKQNDDSRSLSRKPSNSKRRGKGGNEESLDFQFKSAKLMGDEPHQNSPTSGSYHTNSKLFEFTGTSSTHTPYYNTGPVNDSVIRKVKKENNLLGPLFVLLFFGLVGGYLYTNSQKYQKIKEVFLYKIIGQAPPRQPDTEPKAIDQSSKTSPQLLRGNIFVTSSPPGAEVLINGTRTGVFTPGIVSVPLDQPYQILLKKSGYVPHMDTYKTAKVGEQIKVKLSKAVLGYLNIRVSPADAQIYIDGIKLPVTVDKRKIPIPAGREVTIFAKNDVTKTSAKTKVRVKKNSVQSVNLFLKKTHSKK